MVISNNTLGQIKWEQMVFLGTRSTAATCSPSTSRWSRRGSGCRDSGRGSGSCRDVLRQALATPGPVLVNAVVDPHEPPMPPKVDAKQAAKFARSLASGTPNAAKIALTIGSNTVREII